MTNALDAAAVEALDRVGYVVVTGALDDAWIAALRLAFVAAPPQSSGTQHVRVEAQMPAYEAWLRLKEHPVVTAAAKRILDAPFEVHDVHGRNPLPGYGQQGLHTDWPERPPGVPYLVVSALWMLDDFTEDNGATRVVPGSHQMRAIPKNFAEPLAHHPRETIVTGTAGSVLIFNGHLWHSGRKNESDRPRRAGQMVIWREGLSAMTHS